jgi:uncharacterized protein (TIGR03435 family)
MSTLFGYLVEAQTAPRPSSGTKRTFEVASVKPCDRNTMTGTMAGTASPGRVAYNCQTLLDYVRVAYVLLANRTAPAQIEGGPAWVRTERYTITAKGDG